MDYSPPEKTGPNAPYADLSLVGTSRAGRLRRLLGQNVHLLAPTDPDHSLTDILYSRVGHDPDWGPQAIILANSLQTPGIDQRMAAARPTQS